jgi:1,4-alpha-glucan branching enzyme
MPGDEWQKFANLRLLFGYMFTHPGTKLVFMGGEFGQSAEWNHEKSLDWHLLQFGLHNGVQMVVRDLNHLYKTEPGLYKYGFEQKGFQWIDYGDRENSVVAYQRQGDTKNDLLIVVCNFTPEVRYHYRIGVPYRGQWKEVFNSDESKYGGSGVLNQGMLATSPVKYHSRDYSISLTLPPLAITVFKLEKEINEFELNEMGT